MHCTFLSLTLTFALGLQRVARGGVTTTTGLVVLAFAAFVLPLTLGVFALAAALWHGVAVRIEDGGSNLLGGIGAAGGARLLVEPFAVLLNYLVRAVAQIHVRLVGSPFSSRS